MQRSGIQNPPTNTPMTRSSTRGTSLPAWTPRHPPTPSRDPTPTLRPTVLPRPTPSSPLVVLDLPPTTPELDPFPRWPCSQLMSPAAFIPRIQLRRTPLEAAGLDPPAAAPLPASMAPPSSAMIPPPTPPNRRTQQPPPPPSTQRAGRTKPPSAQQLQQDRQALLRKVLKDARAGAKRSLTCAERKLKEGKAIGCSLREMNHRLRAVQEALAKVLEYQEELKTAGEPTQDQLEADRLWLENTNNQNREAIQSVMDYVSALQQAQGRSVHPSEQETEGGGDTDDDIGIDTTGLAEALTPSTPRPATSSSTRQDMEETEFLQRMVAIDELSRIDEEERKREEKLERERLRLEAEDKAARAESERRRARLIASHRLDRIGITGSLRSPRQDESQREEGTLGRPIVPERRLPTTVAVSSWLEGTANDDRHERGVGIAGRQLPRVDSFTCQPTLTTEAVPGPIRSGPTLSLPRHEDRQRATSRQAAREPVLRD